jgi:hypothetical protein
LGKLDNGIQRRLKIMEYPFIFKENPILKHERKIKLDLKDKLKDQKYIDEFMLMMIETATDFNLNNNSNNIPRPNCIDDNVNEYINDNDPTIDFLNKFYIITNKNENKILTASVFSKFTNFNTNKIDARKFTAYFKIHNVVSKKIGGSMFYTGIIAKTADQIKNEVELYEKEEVKLDFIEDDDDDDKPIVMINHLSV